MATTLADNIFKCNSLNENLWILNKISLKYVPYGLIDNGSTGSDDGLVLNRWQSIISSNVGKLYWRIYMSIGLNELTDWGRVAHICIYNLSIISSDNGLQPGQHQAIIWTNDGILLIGPLGTNFTEF